MGASWLTTVFGVLTILGDIGAFFSHFMAENPVPTTIEHWFGWIMGLVTGIGLIVAKSFNVSNSKEPVAPAVVSVANTMKANPAAAVKP